MFLVEFQLMKFGSFNSTHTHIMKVQLESSQ